jgi:hypothetical protein
MMSRSSRRMTCVNDKQAPERDARWKLIFSDGGFRIAGIKAESHLESNLRLVRRP